MVVFTVDTLGSPKPFVEFYGYAHENVTRVVLELPDGRRYGAQTFAAWPGSGLRLWAFPVPAWTASPSVPQVTSRWRTTPRVMSSLQRPSEARG